MEKINIGTYSFGMNPSVSLSEKLKAASEMGYTGIEFLANDLKANSVEALKNMLSEANIECVSLHASIDLISELLPIMSELGGKMVICPMHPFADKEEAIELAKLLEEKGKEAEKYGIKIGYHNHTSEFYTDENGTPLMNYVIENSDPKYVSFQLDCGWATAAGINCVEYINKYSGRFCAIHVKENNHVVGTDKPRSAKESQQRPPMKFDADGKPIFTEEMKKMMEAMRERMKIQCPMGDSSSLIDWNAVKAATDAQNNGCVWTVERENDYAGDIRKCLKEDCQWLLANVK